jgi:hypothetical protein
MRKLPSFSQLSDVSYTVKPVLRGHRWDKEKAASGLLRQVTSSKGSIYMEISMTGQ